MKFLAAASLLLSIATAAAVFEVEDLRKRQGNGSAPVSNPLEQRSFQRICVYASAYLAFQWHVSPFLPSQNPNAS